MSKYDSLKFSKETKARISYMCDGCGKEIKKGEFYYPERMRGMKPLRVKLDKFCYKCGDKLLNKKSKN